MIDIPPETHIKATIKPGSVYYFIEEEMWTSDEPHYFIVINKNLNHQKEILMVCSTTKIQERKLLRKHSPGTLVEINKGQYEGFSKNSIVDCNDVYHKTVDQITNKFKSGDLTIKPEMKMSIIDELRNAVCNSPVPDPDIIDLLTE